MEKINIAELLKDCPKGMELDCVLFNNPVTLDEVVDIDEYICPIVVNTEDGDMETFTKYGQYLDREYAKCIIFPKGKTTWEGFVPPLKLKNGDVIYVKDAYGHKWYSIIDNCKHGALYTYVDICIESNKLYRGEAGVLCDCKDVKEYRRATEEEKEKLFKAIKANGYKWNAETKTLEKLVKPRFKVGDKVRLKNDKTIIKTINYIYHDSYGLCDNHLLFFKEQDEYELVPNKFDINTLVPFESKVLVRNIDGDLWKPAIYGFSHSKGCYVVGGVYWGQCIPYEANKELLGTTNNTEEYGSR